MNIIEKNINEVKPYEKNPRKNDKSVDKVANSIKEFGFKVPIVIDKHNIIVCGHTRYKAAKKLQLEKVPCVIADDLSDEQIKAYRLADNKVGEDSEWDMNLLSEELEDILNLDMSEFGFSFLEDDQEVVEDEYDEPLPEEPKSKLGEIYKLGRHRLMCGDSTVITDVEKLMGNEKADMLLTDPPYNVDYEGTAGKIKNDCMEDKKFRQFLTDAFVSAKTVLKPGGVFHIWHADSEGYNFRGACIDADLKVRQCLIWVKNSLVLGRQDFQWMHEPCLSGENPLPYPEVEEYEDEEYNTCLYGWKEGSKHYWFKNRKQTTILEFDKPRVSKEHPTMKPIKMFDYEIKCNTKTGENILDLFGGSGTTIMACEQNGRNAFVMEYDPKYVDVIIDRWEQFTGEKAVLLNGQDA